jgi:hypothetical protein
MHPLIWGLISIEETAPSWAERVNRAGEGRSRFEGNVRTSKFKTIPFSRDTYRCED